MKKTLVIAGLAVLSTSAHATKARVEALGQDSVRGSEYISDSRNIFRNPALLNSTKNYIVTEWGSTASTGAVSTNDSASAPRAEGGFFREMGSFNYGLYLGNNGNDNGRSGTAGTPEFLRQDNALDLFLAGDMGVQWGAKLHYANAKDEVTGTMTRKNSAFGLGLGAVMGEAEVYTDITLSDKSTGDATGLAADEFKTKPSFIVGGSYKWSSVTFFGSYEANKADLKSGATTVTGKNSTITVGAGRVHEINPTARVFTDASIVLHQDTNETAVGKTKNNTLPVTLGFEADATSWLVLRGSVAQNVILNDTKTVAGKKVTNPNTTAVNAGATLNFGKLKVDGTIGTTNAANSVQTNGGTNTGTLSLSNVMTRVGVSYWF